MISALTISLPLSAVAADLHKHHGSSWPTPHGSLFAHGATLHLASYSEVPSRFRLQHGVYGRMVSHSGGGLQCVAFARATSGIELSGNAADWWDNAAGVYQRGAIPEVGSVLNFRANGRMRLGHVAVVTAVVDSRSVEIDHANWAGPGAVRGAVSRAVTVVDVSPANDWSAVRVELGHTDDFGSIYPTYGFIYNRPDGSPAPAPTMVALKAPIPNLNPAPSDLRPGVERYAARRIASPTYEEVAEAPLRKPLDFSIGSVQFNDAPNRSFR